MTKTAQVATMCALCAVTFAAVTLAAPTVHAQTLGEIADGLTRQTDRAASAVYYTIVWAILLMTLTPPIIAFARGHKQLPSILFVSVFFGWTGIIWAGLLFYASFSPVSGPIGRREIDLLRLEIRKLRKDAENPEQV